ncbi:hypothetical protein C8J56DRAFT_955266 [Mycena floridula]|nr:hypothetical protein C8J56DRAFT_955266 [Mycena floridula]
MVARVTLRPTTLQQNTLALARQLSPSLAIWGVGAGSAALLLLSVTPLVKREVLSKVPVVGSYWEDKTLDKPF